VGGQPVPEQGRLLPAKEAAQLAQGADQRLGVVGVDLVVEPLPGYAPELNPVEALWANLKGVELANLAGDTLEERMSLRRLSVASSASATPTSWPSRSCATAVCPSGEQPLRHRSS